MIQTVNSHFKLGKQTNNLNENDNEYISKYVFKKCDTVEPYGLSSS